jgi:uncharacterized membrane protein (UPF0127 family)
VKRRAAILAAVFLSLLLGLAVAQLRADETPTEDLVIKTQKGASHVFRVEIADDPAELEQGLMFRKHLPETRGMLFQFSGSPRIVSFWMKNTLIPLDMLFIAKDGTIVSITASAAPETLDRRAAAAPVTGVLEIIGGLSEKLGISPGDRVLHPFFGN